MVVDKMDHICYIVVAACPFELQIIRKEGEKVDKFHPLKYEIARL